MYPRILFLHGIRGPADRHRWLPLVNERLGDLGHNPVEADGVVDPDYSDLLSGRTVVTQVPRVPFDWQRPGNVAIGAARDNYVLRASRLSARLKDLAGRRDSVMTGVPVPGIPDSERWDEARRYRDNEAVREAIWSRVVQSVDQGEPLIVIGHSLGSVIAVDALKRLPGCHVVSLVTLGSPLGVVRDFGRHGRIAEGFPYDAVHGWANIYDPRDPVTGGRGASSRFPDALDVPILVENSRLPGLASHAIESYASSRVLSEVLAHALLGQSVERLDDGSVALRIQGLEFPLLRMAYAQQLQRAIPSKDVARSRRVRTAREHLADLSVKAAELIAENDATVSRLTRNDFIQSPATHVRGVWSDRDLVPLAIDLALGWPLPPFELEAKFESEERRQALIQTLNRVRTSEGSRPGPDGDSLSISDMEYADAVYAAIGEARKAGGAGPGRTQWVPFAVAGLGLATLAATGIGLALAVPAGLAGAAVITSTLAAFGPGGMVGGMATLTALSGLGAAVTSGGLAAAVSGPEGRKLDVQEFLSHQFVEVVASASADELRGTLIGIEATVLAQERLRFPSSKEMVRVALHEALSFLNAEYRLHEVVAPGTATTKSVGERRDMVQNLIRRLSPDRSGLAEGPRLALEGRPANG